MTSIELTGHISDTGDLEVEGTIGLRPGTKVKVIVIEDQDMNNHNWGIQVVDLLDTLDLSEWEALEIPDATEWVKQQRRGQDWGNT